MVACQSVPRAKLASDVRPEIVAGRRRDRGRPQDFRPVRHLVHERGQIQPDEPDPDPVGLGGHALLASGLTRPVPSPLGTAMGAVPLTEVAPPPVLVRFLRGRSVAVRYEQFPWRRFPSPTQPADQERRTVTHIEGSCPWQLEP